MTGQRHAPAAVPTGKGPGIPYRRKVDPRAGLDGYTKEKISRPYQDSNPDRPARSESLYRLSYPDP